MSTADIPLRHIAAPSTDTLQKIARPLLIASAASISAGAIHAGAIGAHAEHPQSAKTFAVVALSRSAGVSWRCFAHTSRRAAGHGVERRPVHQLGRRQDARPSVHRRPR